MWCQSEKQEHQSVVLKNRELEIRVKVRVCLVSVTWLSHATELCSDQALEENVESLTEEWEKLEASESTLKEELNVSAVPSHAA